MRNDRLTSKPPKRGKLHSGGDLDTGNIMGGSESPANTT